IRCPPCRIPETQYFLVSTTYTPHPAMWVNGNYTNGVAVYYLFPDNGPDEEVLPGDTITLKMSSITKEYYRFIFELQDQTFEYRNPLFSGPPANITTNISNGGCGFFAAYSVSYASTVYP
ncbi:MAG: DUF4249 family protein, partial [Bacteroidales bacterium]|nr:DUF4249 family protein [Bacteroidales bacterium]